MIPRAGEPFVCQLKTQNIKSDRPFEKLSENQTSKQANAHVPAYKSLYYQALTYSQGNNTKP